MVVWLHQLAEAQRCCDNKQPHRMAFLSQAYFLPEVPTVPLTEGGFISWILPSLLPPWEEDSDLHSVPARK